MLNRWRWAACLVATIALGVDSGMASAQEIFVPNFSNNSVTVYARTDNGNVAPVRAIVGAATGLNGPFSVTVDAVNNELFVASTSGGDSITVYPLRASGNVAVSTDAAILRSPPNRLVVCVWPLRCCSIR